MYGNISDVFLAVFTMMNGHVDLCRTKYLYICMSAAKTYACVVHVNLYPTHAHVFRL